METSIQTKGLSLRPYELVGYFIPSLALVVVLTVFESWIARRGNPAQMHIPFAGAAREIFGWLEAKSYATSTTMIIVGVACIYILGHIIAAVSSIMIDKCFIGIGYGYPFQKVLSPKAKDISPLSIQRENANMMLVRATAFSTNICLVALYSCYVLSPLVTNWVSPYIKPFISAFCLLVGLVMLACWFLRTKVAWGAKIPSVIATPFNLISTILSRLLRVTDAFNPEFRAAFAVEFEKTFRMNFSEAGTNIYWFCYLYVQAHSSVMAEKCEHYLASYAFARNMAASLYFAFLYIAMWVMLHLDALQPIRQFHLFVLCGAPLVLFIVSVFFLIYYYYLYAACLTKFVFRAFMMLRIQSETEKDDRRVQALGIKAVEFKI